jgi:uncharacterized phage protein gp47/JayE
MLDRFGFKRKNYAELVYEMEQRAKELYGENVNLTAKSLIGITIKLFAWFLSKTHELAEKVYNSGHTSKAEGIQLDYKAVDYNTKRQLAQYSTVELGIEGTPNFTVLEGTRFETSSGIDFALIENVVLSESGSGTGMAVCLSLGSVGNVEPNTISIMSEPSVDITFVTNLSSATGGRESETDNEFKERLLKSGASNGSATVNSILAEVLDVSGVRAANVSVNNTNATLNGLPPKSFQVYALGGNGQEIAEAIFNKAAGGIEPFGNTSFTVKDIGGNNHTVKYTPATILNIFSNITVKTNNTFESNGVDQIKDAVIKFIGGITSDGILQSGLKMGDDVIYSKVLSVVMGITGVEDATVTIGESAGVQGSSNIVVDPNEAAQTDTAKINVTVTV